MFWFWSSWKQTIVGFFNPWLFYSLLTVSSYRDKDPGTSLCLLSASVVFAAAMSKTEIQNHIYSSLITLRMKLPGIACTLRKLDSSSEYTFKYEIPRSYDHALSWARTITVFQEYNLPFFEEHNSLKEDNLWRASDGRYTLEVHASASSSGWNFRWVTEDYILPLNDINASVS